MRRLLLFVCLVACPAPGETGYDAWLRYAPLDASLVEARLRAFPAAITVLGDSPILSNARDEMIRGVRGMMGRTLRIEPAVPKERAILLGTLDRVRALNLGASLPSHLPEDGFLIQSGPLHVIVAGANERAVLYGAFALLRSLALGEPFESGVRAPYAPLRWINSWDNLDGTIERGYGGRSIFWEDGHARADLSRVRDYARMLASLGINACSINNVNANPRAIASDFLPEIAHIAEIFRGWGIRIALSVDFGSPKRVGNLETFDPANPEVAAWWRSKIDEIYRAVPDLAGVVMKADSEGRVGPSAYGRTHADAANTVARALKPHGGLIFYRAFVYDHNLDWRNLKNDRARAAYDNFQPLDGRFDDNVVIQIKNGPIDFQVREPASPLFGALEKTNQAIELQITQEYFGQARHNVFLVPYWKDTLDFDLRAAAGAAPVKALAAGKVFHRPTGGFVGVSNVGLDENWFGNHLSQANLYGYGRLAWDPGLTSARILDEWTRLTFGNHPLVVQTIRSMQLESWRAYENYTGPLGLQTLTAIAGTHYGPEVESSERNGWGQWHRSDARGSGMDRTAATGTGFIAQYRPPIARAWESLETCPDDLVLFLHHVPYTHKLHSGKTVIQTIYDLHYAGAETVASWVARWTALAGHIDAQRYQAVLEQLRYQAGAAVLWRDAINNWFHKTSGIADAKGRVGHHPGRIEAESMHLNGYRIIDVVPFEAASGFKAVECKTAACSAEYRFDGKAGWYRLSVRYFDQQNGVSRFTLFVGPQKVDEWRAADHFPSRKIDSASSTLRTISGVALRPGDIIRIEGVPDGPEPAALDYLEIAPEAR